LILPLPRLFHKVIKGRSPQETSQTAGPIESSCTLSKRRKSQLSAEGATRQ
jgi:hypothetical protein